MGKLKRTPKIIYVAAYSIIEVIVSTIIILVAFLSFSYLFGQLISSRRIVPETSLLLKMGSFRHQEGTTDTMAIKRVFGDCHVSNTDEILYSFPFQNVSIYDNESGRILLKYYSLPDSVNVNQLFQQ